MKIKMFSLLDIKVGAYAQPFFMQHAGYAVRACQEIGRDPNTTVGRHPADFSLYELGEFDDATGQVLMHAYAIHHGVVASMLPEARQPDSLPFPELRQRQNGAVTHDATAIK